LKKRAYAALSTSTFLNGVGSNLQLGIWPFYLQRTNVGDELYGAFSTASSLFGIFARGASAKMGSLSESLPFAVGLMASTSMMIIYALSPNPVGIVVGMTLSAVSQALVMVGRTTLVGRGSQGTRLATTYAILITLGNLGLIVGTNVGAVIFPFSNYATVFLIGGLICFIGLLTALVWLPGRSLSSRSRFGVIRLGEVSSTLKRFYLATCLDSFSWNIAMPFFAITPARIFQVTQDDIALIQTLQFGAAIATNLVFGALSDRLWGRRSVLALSELLGVATLGLYVVAPSVQPIFASALLMGLVISSWGPIVAAYVSEASTAEQLHDNVGTWTTLTALVRVPAPLIGGYLAENWFPRAPYLVALFLVAGTAFYIQKYLHEPGSDAQSPLGASQK
jgi:MFS family permease